ncbi:replication endonuclease [Glaciimonas soli]|nr:replication endonuclease [Glaciimonas soli]
MKWFSTQKIYEPIGWGILNTYLADYVPEGLDLSADDGDICALADKAAAQVSTALWAASGDAHAFKIIACECAEYSISPPSRWPDVYKLSQVVARVIDPRWWRRQLRKRHGRAFEAGNIRLGYVQYRVEPYASTDTVLRRLSQNRRNAAALESVVMENEKGHTYTLAELSAKSTSNKTIRRGELMLRMKGFEDIAIESGDEGLFLTLTCPSRFHATHRYDGSANKKFEGATPRDAQDYLCKLWTLIRASLARAGIGVYGFRIAEPHHDGCPHWHLLLFVRRTSEKLSHLTDLSVRTCRIFKRYAWRADRGETGAFKYRFDAKKIDPALGSASGYIAKYISKNIDGANVGDHKTTEGNVVTPDYVGDVEIQPSQRVEAWAACWSIRQFQQIGGAPVGVWRELRRIKKEMVTYASDQMKTAWAAVQRDDELGQRADFARYLKVQGGAIVPRALRMLSLAIRETRVLGRYEETDKLMPYGVECVYDYGVVFYSQRYQWKLVTGDRKNAAGVGVAFDLPRTRVNKCTQGDISGTNGGINISHREKYFHESKQMT